MVKPKQPMEFLKKLRFHRGLSGPGAYGIAHNIAHNIAQDKK